MNEFTLLNKQGVVSAHGFSVQSMSRGTIEYREGARILTIHVEPGMTDTGSCNLYSRSNFAHWDGGSPILPDNQVRIEENFRRAMEFLGSQVVEETPT